jgi:integrase
MVRFASITPSWKMNLSRVLSQVEIDTIAGHLAPKATSNPQALVKLVLFRLAVFCGLRATELCGLNLDDVALDTDFPVIRIRAEIAKCSKAREVPILSRDTVKELRRWRDLRVKHGTQDQDSFLCSVTADTLGHRFSRQGARNRFRAACKCLGAERADSITIHDGRHTCASMSLHKQVPIALVREMLGHSSISVTNTYVGLFRDGKGMFYDLDGVFYTCGEGRRTIAGSGGVPLHRCRERHHKCPIGPW